MSTSTSITQLSQVVLPEEGKKLLQDILSLGLQTLNQQYIPFDYPRIAPFTDDELSAFGMVRGLAHSAYPQVEAVRDLASKYMNASRSNEPMIDLLRQQAYRLAAQGENIDATKWIGAVEHLARLAGKSAERGKEFLDEVKPLISKSAETAIDLAKPFYDFDLSLYKNPYIDAILQRSLDDLQRKTDIQRNQLMNRAAATRSFGGSRNELALREFDRLVQEEMARLSENVRAKAFEDAAQRLRQDQSIIPALYSHAIRGYSEGLQQIGQDVGNLAKAADIYTPLLNYATNHQKAEQAAAMAPIAATNSSYGSALSGGLQSIAGMGNYVDNLVSPLMGIGASQRAMNQSNLDLLYKDFIEQRDWPYALANRGLSLLIGPQMLFDRSTSQTTTQKASGVNSWLPTVAGVVGTGSLLARTFPETTQSILGGIGSIFRGIF